jgi:hypothetical protein
MSWRARLIVRMALSTGLTVLALAQSLRADSPSPRPGVAAAAALRGAR